MGSTEEQCVDEFTAHRWVRAGTPCPVCQDESLLPLPLSMCCICGQSSLRCPVHGQIFVVLTAA